MKRYILMLFASAAIIGCKDNPISKKIKETSEKVSNTTKAANELTKMQDDILELQEIEPLTNDELKALLPEEIKGMKRISFKAGAAAMMQVSSIQASYANEDKSKKFSIQLIDGAGPVGATATSPFRLAFSQDFEEEDEKGFKRTVTKNGKKAVEEHRTDRNYSQVQFMEGNRFYVKSEGENMDLDETWDAVLKINFKNL